MLYISGKGRYDAEYKALWKQLVPVSGQADTLQGELVRVIGRLASEYYRNGNGNWDMGFRLYTNVLHKHLRDSRVFEPAVILQLEADIADLRAWGSGTKDLEYTNGEDAFDRVTDRVVEWCQQHLKLMPYAKRHNQHR